VRLLELHLLPVLKYFEVFEQQSIFHLVQVVGYDNVFALTLAILFIVVVGVVVVMAVVVEFVHGHVFAAFAVELVEVHTLDHGLGTRVEHLDDGALVDGVLRVDGGLAGDRVVELDLVEAQILFTHRRLLQPFCCGFLPQHQRLRFVGLVLAWVCIID